MRQRRAKLSEEELEYIRQNLRGTNFMPLARHLQRPASTIRDAVYRLGLATRERRVVRWTHSDELRLLELAERHSFRDIAQKLNRPYNSVRLRAKKLGIKLFSGTYSLDQIMAETGYDGYQIERARAALNQHWRSRQDGVKKRFLISFEQYAELLEYLKHEKNPHLDFDYQAKRFWADVIGAEDPDGHWKWRKAHPCFSYLLGVARSIILRPSRAAWLFVHGELPPPRRRLQRACADRECINPKHWYLSKQHKRADRQLPQSTLSPCLEAVG